MLGLHLFMFIWLVLVVDFWSWFLGLLSYALFQYGFSKSMEFANIVNCLNICSLDHTSALASLHLSMCAISFPLSLSSISQSNMRWSVVWSPWVQTHSEDWIILKRCGCALVFPCVVTIAVKLGDRLSFIFSRALILGKYSLVTSPLAVASHCCCHFAVVVSDSCRSISLFDIL